jgi:oligopeptide transport system substrate-binding protein
MCAIPVGTPAVASNTIPSAGPYYVRSADLNGVTVLRENPNYDGSRSHEFERIVYTVQDATAITAGLTAGTIDYSPTVPGRDPWWAGFLAAHPDRVKVNAAPGIRYLAINSFNVPLPVRKAINYAIDRNALAALSGAIPDPAADHIIGAGVPGSGSAPFYPMNGNLATATALAAPYTATPIRIVYNVNSAYSQSIVDAVAARLQAIGLTTTVTGVGGYFGFLENPSSVWDVAPVGWAADYLDPDDFVDTLVKGGAPTNLGHFADPTFDARIDAAGQLSGSARYAAYKQLDDDLVRDAAPLAVYANLLNREPFSGRIGCRRFTTPYRIDLASLCEDDG